MVAAELPAFLINTTLLSAPPTVSFVIKAALPFTQATAILTGDVILPRPSFGETVSVGLQLFFRSSIVYIWFGSSNNLNSRSIFYVF